MSKPAPPDLWRIRLLVPQMTVAAFSAALDGFAALAEYETARPGEWLVEAIATEEPDRAMVSARVALAAASAGLEPPPLDIEKLPPIDWVAENQKAFPAIYAGRYFIHGQHDRTLPPAGSLTLRIDAGIAFGTGEHGSTRGCLLSLQDVARTGRRNLVLDLGCGTGILAMAAARTWPAARVTATDIDRDAVMVTRENLGANALAARVRAVHADGLKSRALTTGRYDLIFANILARPLCRLARDLSATLTGNGLIILSGLLASQEREVLAAYRRQGLTLRRRRSLNGWQALVLGRNSNQRRRA